MQGMQSPIMVMSTCRSRSPGTQIATRLFPAAKGRSAFVFSAPAGPSRPDAHLSRLSLTPQTPTPSARRVARRSSTTSPPRRCVFHVGTGRTPPPATRRSGGQSPSPTVERSLGTAPKKRPSLTSRASPFRNPGCLRHHPHHPRSALDAEDDPGRLRRYVSSRARDRAAPEARSWALALQTKRRLQSQTVHSALTFLFWTRC
jgi:hypothetical protein